MDYRHYSTEEIFMAHDDDETEMESESLWETGVGGTSIIKTLKKVCDMTLIVVIFQIGEDY